MLGSTAAPGMAAPHFEQNLTPGAIGDPQFPQNPATNHLRKVLYCCLRARAQHQGKSGTYKLKAGQGEISRPNIT
jgi:hypothetical protein